MYHPYYQSLKFRGLILSICFFLLWGCSSSRVSKYSSQFEKTPFKNSFHGLVVMDPITNKILHNTNGSSYFTPASNTKIVTLYTGLTLLGKNIPVLKYQAKRDSVFVEGLGDPSLLHPYFRDSTALQFLQDYEHILFHSKNSKEARYGPGWAWEDYDTYFSPEKSVLPIYGNVVTMSNSESLRVSPAFFQENVSLSKEAYRRKEHQNHFYMDPEQTDTLEVPFMIDDTLIQQLLRRALNKNVELVDDFPEGPKEIVYGMETDSIYKRMLYESDNFLAEQLLLSASSALSDTLSTRTTINHMLETELSNLEHPPRWVDGSGLSRYNLFTPVSMVHILQKIRSTISEERLFTLFPVWNSSGTQTVSVDTSPEPFIFAKSGFLGNNFNLSGYLKTKSGRLLIFSFMNNHFTIPTSQVRLKVYTILKDLHETY